MARDENGKVIFDAEEQAEVDRVIQERVARVKTEKPADYDDLAGIAEAAKRYGFSGTPAQIRHQMEAQAQQEADEKELEELEALAQDQGISPALQKQINALQKKLDGIEAERQAAADAREAKTQQENAIQQQFDEFKQKYPDVDLNELDKDDRFIRFARKHNGTLSEKYEEYMEIVGDVESSTAARRQSKQDRTTTGGARTGGANYGLTDNQIRLAKESGMSLKDYADKLATIKRR
jgi:hypothetical protein